MNRQLRRRHRSAEPVRDNKIEPGGPDLGQPTHFEVRRHKDVFKSHGAEGLYGATKLVWTVTVARPDDGGAPASIDPVWQIDRRRTTRGGNINDIDFQSAANGGHGERRKDRRGRTAV
jgi:hypothetical protein